METEKIRELKQKLNDYPNQLKILREEKFKKKPLDTFKAYYNSTHTALIEYILCSKNKELSEMAKELPLLDKLFATFNKYVAILIISIAASVSAMVYLYTLNQVNYIYALAILNTITSFFLLKKIQQQPLHINKELSLAQAIFKTILSMIKPIKDG